MKITSPALSFLIEQFKAISLVLCKVPDPSDGLTERRKAILETLKNWGSDLQDKALAYANAIEQFDFKPFLNSANKYFDIGTVLMVVDGTGEKHDYEKGQLICIAYDSRAMRGADGWGTKLNREMSPKYVRLATEDEIKTYYSDLVKMDHRFISAFIKNIFNYTELEITA